MADYVTIKDLASEFGIDRSNCLKFVKAIGLEMVRVRLPGTRGTPLVALALDDAEKVRQERTARGFAVRGRDTKPVLANDGPGVFYIVAVDPEVRPSRLKFGYTQDINSRLIEHRYTAPEATLLRSWPAKRNWEPCIIAGLSIGAAQVGPEVFDVDDVAATLYKAEWFMGMLVGDIVQTCNETGLAQEIADRLPWENESAIESARKYGLICRELGLRENVGVIFGDRLDGNGTDDTKDFQLVMNAQDAFDWEYHPETRQYLK